MIGAEVELRSSRRPDGEAPEANHPRGHMAPPKGCKAWRRGCDTAPRLFEFADFVLKVDQVRVYAEANMRLQ
jgi:hypothetical protein